MPRSGSTLLEQILSSHPEVTAGGELQYFYGWASGFDYSNVTESCQRLARSYLNVTAKVKNGFNYFTDKLPHNFLYIGLIHLCFPNAKIIHIYREPLDACFSCYKQDFQDAHYYSYDLASLGGYYKAYQKHMAHWHEILPGLILDVRYEDIVNNVEKEVRRILDHCNLPWHEECMQFYDSSRFVETASRDQVSRPIYTDSIGRWKHYQQYLAPLINVLSDTRYGLDI